MGLVPYHEHESLPGRRSRRDARLRAHSYITQASSQETESDIDFAPHAQIALTFAKHACHYIVSGQT
jgi:hypothetical protein